MGRNLALGIPTKIRIYGKENFCWINKFRVLENYDKIINHLSTFINPNNYDILKIEDEDYFELNIKEEFVNSNIHKCIWELSKKIDKYVLLNYADDENITLEELYNISLYYHTFKVDELTSEYDKREYGGKQCLEYNNNCIISQYPFGELEYWLLEFDNSLTSGTQVVVDFIPIWIQHDNFYAEREIAQLHFLNNLIKDKFANPLSQDLIFYVHG